MFKSYSFWALLLFAYVVVHSIFNYERFHNVGTDSVISYDILGYYSYLPAHFIYDDLNLEFAKGQAYNTPDMLAPVTTPTGQKVTKYSMGMALYYSPFFAIGHLIALATDFEADGFSLPYRLSVVFGCVGLLLLSLIGLKRLLRRYFSDGIVAFTLLCLSFGTHLFYYVVHESLMSHTASFSLFVAIMHLSIAWHDQAQKWSTALLLGLAAGLVAIIRPTNFLIMLFPLLYGIQSWAAAKARLQLIWAHKGQVFILLAGIVLVLFPQMLYWKVQAGTWWFKAYPAHERLYWLEPYIWEVLFSYRKGWLLYTPMMIFALLGLFFVARLQPKFMLFLAVYLPLNIYVVACWFCWWYGGSFGMRALLEMMAPLSIPLACFWQTIWQAKQRLVRSTIAIAILFIALNLFQTFQYRRGYIHWDSMTKEAYWFVFGKTALTEEEKTQLKTYLDDPTDELIPYKNR